MYFPKAYDMHYPHDMHYPVTQSPNTNTQMHKYTNTASVKVAERPNMCYIFEKLMVRGPQKQCSHVSDMQIHNTNTQIHKYKDTNTVWVKFADTP